MIAKPAASQSALHELLARRWSPRAFDPKRLLTPAQITTLLEAARWAPSCFNDQPWRFLACDRATAPDAWSKLLGCLGEKNQLWARNAPLLLLSCASANFHHNDKPNRWAQYDSGAAALSLCLQATAMGLSAHQMGGFDADKARAAFSIPESCTPMAAMAVGYQGELADLPGEFHQAEQAPRERAALDSHFFMGQWRP